MTGAFLAGLVAGYGVAIPVGAIAILILGLSARTSFRVGAAAALGVATADGLYAAVAALGGAAVASRLAPFAGPLRLVAAGVLLALACLTAWRALRPPAPRQKPSRPTPIQEPTPAALTQKPTPPAPTQEPTPPAPVQEPTPPAPIQKPTPLARTPEPRPPAPTPEPSAEGGRTHGASAATPRPTAPRGGLDTPVRAFAAVLALTLLNPATVVYFVALVLGRGDVLGSGPAGAAAFTAGVFLASASWQLLIAGGGSLIGRALTGPRGRRVTALLSSVIIAALAVATALDV
ncbi:LysE family transporter [Micromonospora sp. C32]|uniref:LysE family transporter n=1 Tax=unclassified Micromonospora TaxID=2617518 RepID=UPI001B373C31|nr:MULTISPECIES: LysE family transporter [unclassified Micromonospora]MBQ1043436.1 LysE family transporter [Micromonospora sp. C72]MBQ1053655.1 LysE family transporter [Micromonospora sp. C32]